MAVKRSNWASEALPAYRGSKVSVMVRRIDVIVVLKRVMRAVSSVSERRVERDWWSEGESWCGSCELEVLDVGLENGCKIEDIVGSVGLLVWDVCLESLGRHLERMDRDRGECWLGFAER